MCRGEFGNLSFPPTVFNFPLLVLSCFPCILGFGQTHHPYEYLGPMHILTWPIQATFLGHVEHSSYANNEHKRNHPNLYRIFSGQHRAQHPFQCFLLLIADNAGAGLPRFVLSERRHQFTSSGPHCSTSRELTGNRRASKESTTEKKKCNVSSPWTARTSQRLANPRVGRRIPCAYPSPSSHPQRISFSQVQE